MADLMFREELDSLLRFDARRQTAVHPQPVFLLGSMRSGTSLLALSLAQHHSIVSAQDTGWIERFAIGLQETFADATANAALPHIAAAVFDRSAFFSHFGDAISRMQVGNTSASRWVDSAYTNAFLVAPLAQLFPHGRFIHVVRDVDSVVASLTSAENRRSYRSQHKLLGVRDAYEHWLDVVTACVEAEHCLGSDRVLRIRRDDLVLNPEPTLRRVFDFIGESFEWDAMRPFSGLADPEPRPYDEAIDESWRMQADVLSRTLLAESSPAYRGDDAWRARLDNAFLRRCSPA